MKANCHDIREWSALYADGRLDNERAAALDAHRTACARCASELERTRAAAQAFRTALAASPVPVTQLSAARQTLLRRFFSGNIVAFPRAARPKMRTWRRLTSSGVLAASVMIGSLLGFESGRQMVHDVDAEYSYAALDANRLAEIERRIHRSTGTDQRIVNATLTGAPTIDHLYPPGYGLVRRFENDQIARVTRTEPFFGLGGPNPSDVPWNYGLILF